MKKDEIQRELVPLTEFRRAIQEYKDVLNEFESVLPEFGSRVEKLPFYVRWKSKLVMWRMPQVIREARKEISYYEKEYDRIEQSGDQEVHLDVQILKDISFWTSEGIVQEFIRYFLPSKNLGPYR